MLGGLLMVAAAASLWGPGGPRPTCCAGSPASRCPILSAAGVLSMLAGVALESQLEVFNRFQALYLLELAFVSSLGALGGILSSRLATGFQLGTMDALVRPGRAGPAPASAVAVLAVPVMVFNAVGAHVLAVAVGQSTPGLLRLLAAALVAGSVTVLFVLAVAYYGTLAAFRVGLDPDNYGIPIVTSSVDFVGALSLVVTIISLGIV